MRTSRNRGRREKFLKNTIQSPGLTYTEGSQHHLRYKWWRESIIISCASKYGTYFKRTKESWCLQDCWVRKRAVTERQEFKELKYQTLKLAWSHLTFQKPTHPHLLSLRYPTPAISYTRFLKHKHLEAYMRAGTKARTYVVVVSVKSLSDPIRLFCSGNCFSYFSSSNDNNVHIKHLCIWWIGTYWHIRIKNFQVSVSEVAISWSHHELLTKANELKFAYINKKQSLTKESTVKGICEALIYKDAI